MVHEVQLGLSFVNGWHTSPGQGPHHWWVVSIPTCFRWLLGRGNWSKWFQATIWAGYYWHHGSVWLFSWPPRWRTGPFMLGFDFESHWSWIGTPEASRGTGADGQAQRSCWSQVASHGIGPLLWVRHQQSEVALQIVKPVSGVRYHRQASLLRKHWSTVISYHQGVRRAVSWILIGRARYHAGNYLADL